MDNFWDKLNTPIPLYTPENVSDTILYIENHSEPMHRKIFRNALVWVKSVLAKVRFSDEVPTRQEVFAAHDKAVEEHEKAALRKDFAAAVRWRYVMTALEDYAAAAGIGILF